MKKLSLCTLVTVFALLNGTVAHGATTTFVCDYRTYSNEKGTHKAQEGFRLTFVVDAETKKAYMVGNNGSTEVRRISQESGVTFVEVTDVGNVMVTAIDKRGKSVHSRQGIISGEIVPSQYYGSCRVM